MEENKKIEEIEYNIVMELLKEDWVFVEHYRSDEEQEKETGKLCIITRVCYKYFVFALVTVKDLDTGETVWTIADSYLHDKYGIFASKKYEFALETFAIIKEEIIKIIEKVNKNTKYGCNLYEKLKRAIIKRLDKVFE